MPGVTTFTAALDKAVTMDETDVSAVVSALVPTVVARAVTVALSALVATVAVRVWYAAVMRWESLKVPRKSRTNRGPKRPPASITAGVTFSLHAAYFPFLLLSSPLLPLSS